MTVRWFIRTNILFHFSKDVTDYTTFVVFGYV